MKPNGLLVLATVLSATACGDRPSAPAPAAPAPAPAPPPAPAPAPVAAAAAADATSLSDLEGEIALTWTSAVPPRPPQSIVVQVKAGKLHFSVPEGVESARGLGEKAHVVVDTLEKKLFAISEKRKQVVRVDLEQMDKQWERLKEGLPQSKPATKAPPKVEKTGRSDVVAGYACEEWELTTADGDKSRLCVGAIRTAFFSLPTMKLPAEQAWAHDLFDGGHLPLRVVTLQANGDEKGRLEVAKVEKKAVDDAVFAMPAGYKVIDLDEMMRGMEKLVAAMQRMPPGAGGPGSSGAPGQGAPPDMQAIMRQMAAARGKAGAKGGEPPPDMKAMMEQMKAQAQAAKAAKAGTPEPPPASK